jgi:protein involved in polysaccharide export with SLBB domain
MFGASKFLKVLLAFLVVAAVGVAQSQPAPNTASSNQASSEGTNEILGSIQGAGRQTGAPALQRRNPRYQIERGDQLSLNFTLTPEYNETVNVQPDGYISLVGLPDMHVQGQTTPELTTELEKSYSKLLHDPILTVTLKSSEDPYFIATGQVTKPGKYTLRGETTVTQGIALAGGFTDTKAKDSQVLLVRRVSNDWVSATKLDVKHMYKSGDLSEDLELQPGDMIFVPKNRLSKVQPFLPYLLPYNLFRINYQGN